jgi:LCP family protein required for cell wall assembly
MSTPVPSNAAHAWSRPIAAALLSALVPGLGQAVAGDWRRGLKLFIIDLELILIAFLLVGDRIGLLTALVDPTALSWMMVLNVVLLAYRAWAAEDAYRLAGGRSVRLPRPPRLVWIAAAVLSGIVVVAPHAAFGVYNLTQYDLVTSVFAEDDLEVPTIGGPSASPESPNDGAANAPGTGAAGAPASDGGTSTDDPGSPVATTNAPAIKLWDGLERLNILLLGGDFGEGRRGIRTDTIITVSIDPASGDVAMFSIPRNWTYSPLPDGYGVWDCDCYPELINELWIAGERYPDAFPGPGTPSENAVKAVVSEFLGIPIHYYALVNLDGFVSLVDAFGGVEINVANRIVDETYPHEDGTVESVTIEPGPQRLDGHLALVYARTRRTSNDYVRMARQRCVLEAMVEQADPTTLLFRYPMIADVLKDSITTDIPISRLPDFIELLPNIDTSRAVNVRFIPPEYRAGYRPDGGLGAVADIDLVHEHVQLVLSSTPEEAAAALGLEDLDDTCDPADTS